MDKNRFETQKEMVYLDYTNRLDSPQLYFTVDDLKWLMEKAEEAEHYKDTLKSLQHFTADKKGEHIQYIYDYVRKCFGDK